MLKKPDEDGQRSAEEEAGDDREIEGSVFAAMDDVSREAAEAQREFSIEVEESADDDQECAEDEEDATELAKRIHKKIVSEMPRRSNEARKRGLSSLCYSG